MPTDLSLLVIVLAFTAVTAIVFVVGRTLASELKIQQRAAATQHSTVGALTGADALIAGYFNEKKFGIEGSARSKLRLGLLQAGYFHPNAINYYIFWRIACVVLFPLAVFLLVEAFLQGQSSLLKVILVAVAMIIGLLVPDAYISRRQRILQDGYRITFPDLLDLLVVCVDAGLSIEAAFNRVAPEITHQSRALGANLVLMGAEMRVGRGLIEALDALSERMALDEMRSFVGLFRQSVELGTDVGDALRAFSDDMRDRRLMRAEEKGNKLPVKMVLPLGLCIFPVILLMVLLPVVIRLMTVFFTI
jgi:tight adherence protein C